MLKWSKLHAKPLVYHLIQISFIIHAFISYPHLKYILVLGDHNLGTGLTSGDSSLVLGQPTTRESSIVSQDSLIPYLTKGANPDRQQFNNSNNKYHIHRWMLDDQQGKLDL